MSTTQNPMVITIGPIRFSYLQCFEPKAIAPGSKEKFSVSAIIDATDTKTLNAINAAVEAAKAAGITSKWGGKLPPVLKLPLRDGSERPDDEAYRGKMFVNAHADQKPGIVDANRNPILSKDAIGSGDYGYLNISFYPYDSGGSKGVAAGFNHIMKTQDGEKLAGRVSVDDAFGAVENAVNNSGNSAAAGLM